MRDYTVHGRVINNHYDKDGNYVPYGEVNSGEIMTVQNEAYSIKELLDKFTTGVMQPEMLMKAGIETEYEEDVMDSHEPEPYVDRLDVEEHIKELKVRVKAFETAKKAKKTKDEALELAEKAKKEEVEREKAGDSTKGT